LNCITAFSIKLTIFGIKLTIFSKHNQGLNIVMLPQLCLQRG